MDVPHRLTRLTALALLALAFAVGSGVQAWRDAATFDEPVYLSTGVAALTQHDLSVNPEHAPLFKALAALPTLLVHPVAPDQALAGDEQLYSAEFLRAQEAAGRWHAVVFTGRLVPLGEALLAGLLVALLAARLVGPSGAVVAAALWWSAPLVLGLGHLDGVDLPFALTTLALVLALLRLRSRRRPGDAALVGVACGLAVTAQFTGLLLIAVAGILMADWARTWRTAIGWVATLVASAWAALWAGYLVLDPAQAAHATWGLPEPFVAGIRYLLSNDTVPATGYLLGHTWTGGRWWYWPLSFVIKTPIPTLLLIAAGCLAWWHARRAASGSGRFWRGGPDSGLPEGGGAVLALPAVVLTAALLFVPRDIGVRYLLPQFALLCVLAAAVVAHAGRRLVRALTATAVVGSLAVGALSVPDSIAYASLPFSPAYRTVSNSSVDWGQGLSALQHWAAGKHAYVSYFGPRGTGPGDVPGGVELVGVAPSGITGWVAVSATNLTTERAPQLAWLRKYCPVQVLADSVLLFHFTTPPDPAPGPAMPLRPCN